MNRLDGRTERGIVHAFQGDENKPTTRDDGDQQGFGRHGEFPWQQERSSHPHIRRDNKNCSYKKVLASVSVPYGVK